MISKLDALITQNITKDTAGVAVAVIQNGDITYANGHGLASLEWGIPADTDTIFQWGALTTTYTAMAIMILAEQGKLHPDDLITSYLPEYNAGGHDIMIHQLLTHTAGIRDKVDFQDNAKSIHLPKSPQDFLRKICEYPIEFKPSTRHSYSHAGYQLLGIIIERVAGMPYEAFIQTQIFDALSMTRSYMLNAHDIYPKYAQGYINRDDNFHPAPYQNISTHYSAGSLGGTLDDLIKWDFALRSNQLISDSASQHMYQPTTLLDGTISNYAYGWQNADFKGHHVVINNSRSNGFCSYHARFIEADTSIILLSNWENFNLLNLLTKIAKVAFGLESEKQRPYILGGDALAKCVGRYSINEMRIDVNIKDGQILWQTEDDARLLPIRRNEFIFVDNPDAKVIFGDEENGVYMTATIHMPFLETQVVSRL